MKKHHLHYTLIEVLVAVAVLALMMSFLFQFTAGAQRIWSATNANTDISTNADILFTLMDEDLTQMIVDGAEGMPFTGAVSATTADANFDFYAISNRKGGVESSNNKIGSLIFVRYHYVAPTSSSDGRIYRVQKSAEDDAIYGADNSAPSPNITDADYTEDALVAEGVTSFGVSVWPDGTTDTLPQILRVEVTLDRLKSQISERKSDNDANFAHVFSKVYFPGMK